MHACMYNKSQHEFLPHTARIMNSAPQCKLDVMRMLSYVCCANYEVAVVAAVLATVGGAAATTSSQPDRPFWHRACEPGL